MSLDNAGNDRVALVVVNARDSALQFHHRRGTAHAEDGIATDGKGLGEGLFPVHGDDAGVGDDEIGNHGWFVPLR